MYRSSLKNKMNPYWKHILWQILGNSAAQIIYLLSFPIITRIYSPEHFAILNIFNYSIALLTLISLKYEYLVPLPKADEEAKEIIDIVFLLSLFFTFVLSIFFLASEYLIKIDYTISNFNKFLVFAPLGAFILNYSIAIQNYIQRKSDYKFSGISEIINKLSYVGISIFGYFLQSNVWVLIIAVTISPIFKIFFLRKKLNIRTIITTENTNLTRIKKTFKIHRKPALSMSVANVLTYLTGLIPTLYVNKYFGLNTAGNFALVLSTLYLPSSIFGRAVGQVYYQQACTLIHSKRNVLVLWNLTNKKLILYGFPIYLFIFLKSDWLYPLFFGEKWQKSGGFASILAISAFLSFLSTPFDRTAYVLGINWYTPSWNLVRLITTMLVVLLSYVLDLTIEYFLYLFTFQMSLMYLIDLFMQRHFIIRSER